MNLAIIGAGDLGRLMAHHATLTGLKVVGFIDDYSKEDRVDGYKILGNLKDIESLRKQGVFTHVILGIGYNHLDFKKSLYLELKSNNIPLGSIISLGTFVDQSAKVGDGCFLLPGTTLDKGVVIEDNSVLNTGVIVAHDSVIGKHCFLGPGVKLAGFINVGEQSFLGVGTTVIDNLNLCEQTQTGGGAVLINSTTKKGLYIGVPAIRKK